MNTFFINELRRCCDEIKKAGEDLEKVQEVMKAYERVIHFSKLARREGLLALEEAAENLDFSDKTQAFLGYGISLIVDGTEPELVEEMGINQIAIKNASDYECLIFLLYHKAVLLIQSGVNPRIMEQYLMSLVPDFISEKMKIKNNDALQKKEEKKKDKIALLCKDDVEIDKKDHSIVNQTTLTLLELSDMEIQRLLRETENVDLLYLMKVLPGNGRKRIFDNLSERLGVMIAEEMDFIGSIRMKDGEAVCVNVMKKVIALEVSGEIRTHDFSILQLVIDMYDSAQKENQELRKKYKELHEMLERIYKA